MTITNQITQDDIQIAPRQRWSTRFHALILLSLLALMPTLAMAQPCIQFFENENFGGARWSFFCGEPSPAYSAWNDEITSMKIPDGYKVIAYEHALYGGAQKTFVGWVPNVGSDFNDIISSIKLEAFDSSRCVTAYDDANYQGESWTFCPGLPAPPHARWNDNISSFKMPPNYKVKFCVGLTHIAGKPVGTGLCRSYFRDMPFVGGFVNDEFSYIETIPFESDNFSMAVMSDPQYWYCDSTACKSIDASGNNAKADKANLWHAQSIDKIRDWVGSSRFAGVIVNGDLVHGSPGGDIRETQLNNYYTDYENRFHFNVWPGLGNHDYDNYVGYGNGDNGCNRGSDISAIGDCTIWMMRDLVNRISTMDLTGVDYTVTTDPTGLEFQQYLKGSFSYSWDVGNYHFVQLHNHPAYERNQSAYLSAEITRVFVEVKKSLVWLDNDLTASASRNAIINLHVMGTDRLRADKFGPTKTPEDWKEFRKILGRHPNVSAVFAGHYHHLAGQDKSYDASVGGNPGPGITTLVEDPDSPGDFISGRQVPVFYSGSAQYNKLLWVNFQPYQMTVWTIDTRDGKAPCTESGNGYSCPGIKATKTIKVGTPPPAPPPPRVQLTVEILGTDPAGVGTGSVTVSPSPISTVGGLQYAPGTFVELIATPSSRSQFVEFAGASAIQVGCGGSPSCILQLDIDRSIQAVFTPKPLLYLDAKGGGSASSSPAGEPCSGTGNCRMYLYGATVNLVPASIPRSAFDHWEGDEDCLDGQVTMQGDRRCTAVFVKSDYLLTVDAHDGYVESNQSPGIIDCGTDCSELYSAGGGTQTLILTATPDPGFQFVRWYGDEDCWDEDENDGVPERISLTVGDRDISCSARFVEIGTEYVLGVSKLGVPGALITATAVPFASSADLDCPLAACAQSYPVSTVVQLAAKPVRGSIFEGWDGDADCVDGQVTMTDNIQCSARFTAKILIVDGSDNDNLRNQYVSVLNNLPDVDYDEWSVRSPNSTSNPDGRTEPIASDLAAYSRVIWYTGDAFADGDVSLSAGPSLEAEASLAEYLDSGGCLLVSSPQYLSDRGVTQFAETYLGVGSIQPYSGQLRIEGAGPLPGFNQLGPYSLQHNDEGLDPALTNSSVVHYPVAGNDVMFNYSDGGEAAITRDNGVFRTAFMSFPFLALPSGSRRIDTLGAFLDYCLEVERDDVFEMNDDFASPTGLGGNVILTELRIMPGNEDYFRWESDWSADTRFRIGFPRDSGELRLEVYNQAQQLIATSESLLNSEEVIVPGVLADQLYFLRVFGLESSSNRYALSIEAVGSPAGDLDNDGVGDADDAFPDDPLEQSDADGDGVGDNADLDDDNDGMPDTYEIEYGLDPFDPADAGEDPDEDQFTNLEESEWQTDPGDPSSTPPTFTNGTFGCDGVSECSVDEPPPELILQDGFESEVP
jgi:cytolysin (calcineurin-like family phosphatase)